MIAPSLRNLPIGFPKLMVSTVASGNTRQYVGCSDITMMYSVVDECGVNQVSQQVFTNAAYAIAGMAKAPRLAAPSKPSLVLTMFGVTTVCVSTIEKAMAEEYDCLVFHCTGTGGEGMEKLIKQGSIGAAIDLTTTELCDYVSGKLHGVTGEGVLFRWLLACRPVSDLENVGDECRSRSPRGSCGGRNSCCLQCWCLGYGELQ